MTPVQLKVKEDKYLFIKWEDNSSSKLQLAHIRRYCPCAICTSDKNSHEHDYIKVYSEEQLTINSINIVGNYAVKIKWADNHDTGIYDFGYLKKISDL